jgi:hypothetical protein
MGGGGGINAGVVAAVGGDAYDCVTMEILPLPL